MKTRNLLYLFSLLIMMFVSIPKISNAAPPDDPCKLVEITCPDGTLASGLVCNEEDLTFYLEYFCKLEVKIEIID
ncbi:MAG: hypothetical protein E7065_06830 [Lentimicrobiaceae bacterium]|nr:hypothetical protein [Lentimicrobiaceae bacterium]